MKTLEGMARELYKDYSLKETGGIANWNYLSKERKVEWMKEVLSISSYFLKELIHELKPIPNNKVTNTSYLNGYNDGIRSERAIYTSNLEKQYQKLVEEYNNFLYS